MAKKNTIHSKPLKVRRKSTPGMESAVKELIEAAVAENQIGSKEPDGTLAEAIQSARRIYDLESRLKNAEDKAQSAEARARNAGLLLRRVTESMLQQRTDLLSRLQRVDQVLGVTGYQSVDSSLELGIEDLVPTV